MRQYLARDLNDEEANHMGIYEKDIPGSHIQCKGSETGMSLV
jgi:hypothetical protein